MNDNKITLQGTKAETLVLLSEQGFNVPKVYYFSVQQWRSSPEAVLGEIEKAFAGVDLLAVRSSSRAEDTSENSMAGAFESVLNVPREERHALAAAISRVIRSYESLEDNQVLVQPMIRETLMSGVAMTKVLDDGSPYYVINFDDSTGKTDTVTSGSAINKTVYIYNGVKEEDFDSPLLLSVIRMIWQLETLFHGLPLDIEFAIDKEEVLHLLQVRKITTSGQWKESINELVSQRISYLVEYVDKLMQPRVNIFGSHTLLGFMPDWNPAEMIGVVPRPLAMSLYRELITRRTWSVAREKMGYRKMPNVELMVSLFGRAYIDVRNSMNSFLPEGLEETTAGKLVNAYLRRLEQYPQLHDKIEFEIVPTAYAFDFDETFAARYEGVLTREEYLRFKGLLRTLTRDALAPSPGNTLEGAMRDIERLKRRQERLDGLQLNDPFAISDHINTLAGECIELGTLPFSIIARHGFIAETLLRSAVKRGAIDAGRVSLFRRSIRTVAGELSEDFYRVATGTLDKETFLERYGHLRPNSYDIMSPRYRDRKDLFGGAPRQPETTPPFRLTRQERKDLNILLAENGFDALTAGDLLDHARRAIVGREYAKFVFTKHLSTILEHIARWGELLGFDRDEVSMLTLQDILSVLFSPLTNDVKQFFVNKIERARENHAVASSFKLSYLIRSTRDIFVVPQQRSAPNFIGNRRIEAPVYLLTPYIKKIPDLRGRIVCIEGADPGYDWIFSREIAGLVTKYGGANSHMAIRCAEYDLPAAIGCGEQPFERILNAGRCLLDCQTKRLEPVTI